MSMELGKRYQVDILAKQAGSYFSVPSEQNLIYMNRLFSVCEQFDIRYYSATPKECYFVEEVAHVAWARQKEEAMGIKAVIRPAFA